MVFVRGVPRLLTVGGCKQGCLCSVLDLLWSGFMVESAEAASLYSSPTFVAVSLYCIAGMFVLAGCILAG